LKKKKPVRAVIDTNLFVSGLFAAQGYSSQLQQLWVSGAFELAVSEQILKEIENTLLKPHIRKRLCRSEGRPLHIYIYLALRKFTPTIDLIFSFIRLIAYLEVVSYSLSRLHDWWLCSLLPD
jgi:putative PIN family toxin of toxin-antitoxin system